MTGEPIGRWGPVHAPGGRTDGLRCVGFLACDDVDVQAWLKEAKWWRNAATQLRELVVNQWGPDTTLWPTPSRMAEVAYLAAGQTINGKDVGYWDSSRVDAYAEAQRQLKTTMEIWVQALEEALGASVDVGPELGKNPADDPEDLPPLHPFPDLPSIGLGGLLGDVKTIVLVVGGVWLASQILGRKG